MAQQYASKQPKGFKNHVERVAVVGMSGTVGKHITGALLKTGKHKVTAITRADSASKAPAGVEVKKVNYDDQATLVEALKGQEALIITMGVMAPPDQQTKLIDAAAAANVPWVLPNEYGYDIGIDTDGVLGSMREKHTEYRKHVEDLGKSSWIGVTCGFWYEFSLAGTPYRYGFDLKNRTAIFFDDGNTRINTSTLPQTGLGVAKLLSLKLLPDDESDKSPCMTQFRNKFIYISSFNISQKDMLESAMRVTGTTLKDWKIEHEPSKERYQAGVEMLQKGDMNGFAQLMYTKIFFPNGDGDYEASKGLQNGILGLPKEDIDKYTKIAIDQGEGGY